MTHRQMWATLSCTTTRKLPNFLSLLDYHRIHNSHTELSQFQHPYQPMSYAAKPKAQDQMPKTFSATPVKKKVLTKLPYFSYSMPAKKTVAQTKVLLSPVAPS